MCLLLYGIETLLWLVSNLSIGDDVTEAKAKAAVMASTPINLHTNKTAQFYGNGQKRK